MTNTNPLEWLREIGNAEEIERRLNYANHVHGGTKEVFGGLLAVVPALIDVAEEAEGHRHDYVAGALDNALSALEAAIRREMERGADDEQV